MHCKHLSREGLCEGEYSGYACIKKHCSSYREAMNCEFKEGSGDYCKKYGRFYCAGKENCGNAGDFMRSFDTRRKKRDGNFHGRKL